MEKTSNASSEMISLHCAKGQLILKCPFGGVFKSPIKPTKKFPGFLPLPLKRRLKGHFKIN